MRSFIRLVLVLAATALIAALGLAAITLAFPRPLAQKLASQLLARDVMVEDMRLTWASSIGLHLQGLRIANIEGAEEPAMITLGSLSAEIDRAALFSGRLLYRKLLADGLRVVLERDGRGLGNWDFDGTTSAPTKPPTGLAMIPRGRGQFPQLSDLTLTHAEIRYRTSKGRWLVTRLDEVRITSSDAASPVRLLARGRYNDRPVMLDATTASFDVLRDPARPFDTALRITAPDMDLDFRGVMTEPLDIEGAEGRLSLEVKKLGALLVLFGEDASSSLPMRVQGGFSRKSDDWSLEDARGSLAGNSFEGKLHLREGPRGGSDSLSVEFSSADLDLASIFPDGRTGGGSLRPDTAADGAHVNLRLSAKRLRHGSRQLAQDVGILASSRPGHLVLQDARARLAGGVFHAGARLEAANPREGRLQLQASLSGADAGQLAMQLAGDDTPLGGRLDASVNLNMTGPALPEALARATGMFVIGLQDGRISRRIVEAVSADLRALLRRPGDTTELRCLLGVARIAQGQGEITKLQLRTAEGRIDGGGSFNPSALTIDLLLKSDPETTGFLAMDVPIRIHGPLFDPTARPARGTALPQQTSPPTLPAFARDNPCRS